MAKEHKHKWGVIRKGYPQRICKCGILRTPQLKVGANTITLSPAAVDVIHWTTSGTPSHRDLSNNANGRPLFAVGDPTGSDVSEAAATNDANPLLFTRWQTNPAAITTTAVGTNTTMTVTSPTAAVTIASTVHGYGTTVSSIAAAASVAAWTPSVFTETRGEQNPVLSIVFGTGATITTIRYWVGMFSATWAGSTSTPALSYAAMRYDTTTDGTVFWRCVTDSGTGTPQTTTTTLSVVASTVYRFRIICDSSTNTYKFYSGNVFLASHATTRPAVGTAMSPMPGLTTNGTAVVRTASIYRVAMGQNVVF